MPDEKEQVLALREQGLTISKIAKELDVSVSTVKRRLKADKVEIFPRYQNAVIVKPCPNQRLIMVKYDGITRVAIKSPHLIYRPKQEVTLELIDADTCKLL